MREFTYPVSVGWAGGRLVTARVEGKAPLDVATPPEFKGTHPEVWSPEDLLVASAASCYAVTLVAFAERAELPLSGLAVESLGRIGRTDEGFRFTGIELDVSFETAAGREDEAERLAEQAEDACFVSLALSIPVTLRAHVGSRRAA